MQKKQYYHFRKMIANGFKHKNVPITYLKAKRSNPDTQEPDDLVWSYVFTNNQLLTNY